jgi:hypothetical protein
MRRRNGIYRCVKLENSQGSEALVMNIGRLASVHNQQCHVALYTALKRFEKAKIAKKYNLPLNAEPSSLSLRSIARTTTYR